MPKYAIGLDYGTLSGRAVLVDIKTGEIIAEGVFEYPHGVMDTAIPTGRTLPPMWALQDPQDYIDALYNTIRLVMVKSQVDPEDIVGIGIDVTSATILPVKKDLTPLCQTDEFRDEPNAYIKLWKHHGAEEEAIQIDRLIKERREPWWDSYGGKVSSEWAVPKMLETLHKAPELYEATDYFMDAMDWLTSMLTGTVTASACGMGYKAFYQDGKFPGPDFFGALDPKFRTVANEKLPRTILPIGSCAGTLCEKMAEELHLRPGIPVATAIIDAHAAVPGGGIGKPGVMMIIVGTSACHMMLADHKASIPGVQGIVKDGIMPGFYGIEAGQPAVGDHFAWFTENCVPESYALEARERDINLHQLLSEKLAGYTAGKSGLVALDWWNGVRSPLMDFDLNGLLLGMNLRTKPEDIYLALIEATAYGTRAIIDQFENSSVPVESIVLSGGIPLKNPLIVQIYADILNRPIRVCASTQACAMGAAILGIAAAPKEVTGYADANEIAVSLGKMLDQVWTPNPKQAAIYNKLYDEYRRLADYFGRGGNDVMKHLNAMRG